MKPTIQLKSMAYALPSISLPNGSPQYSRLGEVPEGWFDFWGGSGSYPCMAQREGADFGIVTIDVMRMRVFMMVMVMVMIVLCVDRFRI